jgi:DNA-binding transcriptional LysR family regulator
MNIQHLETFAWIVRLGSFTAAARKLETSQPAVSMRVRELERSLGVKLFERAGRATRVTPKGRAFVDYAERILALSREAEERVGDGNTFSGRVRLGVTETIALTWLPRLVARLNEDFPAMMVDLDIDLTHGLWRKLRAGDLELALLPGPAYGPDLVTEFLGAILYTWMVSPKRHIAPGVLAPADLEAQPVITLATDSNLHDVIEHWFRYNNAEPHRIDVCNSLGVVAALTVAGLGVSLLPPGIFQREIEQGQLTVLEIKPELEPLDFWSVYPRARDSALHRAIVERASEISTFHVDESRRPATRGKEEQPA